MNKESVKQILQKEITFHNEEQEKHKRQKELNQSKRQKNKELKHLHKRFQTVKIAKALGFKFCECCGALR